MSPPEEESQEEASIAFVKSMSGIAASLAALKHATITGTGIIIRTAEGYYEAPNPLNIEIREKILKDNDETDSDSS